MCHFVERAQACPCRASYLHTAARLGAEPAASPAGAEKKKKKASMRFKKKEKNVLACYGQPPSPPI